MNETQEADFKRLTPAMKRIICSAGMSTNNWSGVVGQEIRPALILEEREIDPPLVYFSRSR